MLINFYVLLTAHSNITVDYFFINLKHKFSILKHLLHSSTCFEHYCAHLQEDNCINLLTPNDDYSGRTAPLTSKCCILYIYSTNIGTEYFKHGIHSPFFPLQNAVCFIILTYLVSVLFTFYIQDVLKLKKIIPAPKVNIASGTVTLLR